MGSAAFIMASFLEVPYVVIMEKAVMPAILYFLGVGIGVFFMVRASGIRPPREEVDVAFILRSVPTFLIPMGVLLTLLFRHYSPGFAAFWAIISLVIVAQLRKNRATMGQWVEAFSEGAQLAAQIALILITIGILAQAAVTTNLATKLTISITSLVGHELIPILLISMVAGILLGMELPTPVAYILMFITVVPLMIDAGVDVYAANFFAFYFAILSTITPPIALSVLTASRLSGGNFLATCRESIKLSLIGYILPFAFVFNAAILGFPGVITGQGVLSILIMMLAMVAGGAALYGYFLRRLTPLQRTAQALAAISGFLFVFTGTAQSLGIFIGLLTVAILLPFIDQLRARRAQSIEGDH
jgi:TRAP-type uncharacterized transport system fused permease subunit